MLTARADANHTHAESFQGTSGVPLEVFAQPDHPFAGPDKAAQPVGRFTAEVDWRNSISGDCVSDQKLTWASWSFGMNRTEVGRVVNEPVCQVMGI